MQPMQQKNSNFFAQSPNTSIDSAIRISHGPVAMRNSIAPFSEINASIWSCQPSLPITLTFAPFAFIHHATRPCCNTVPAAKSCLPRAFVDGAVWVNHSAEPFSSVILPLAIIYFATRPSVNAAAVLFICSPQPVVGVAVVPTAFPESVFSPFGVHFTFIFPSDAAGSAASIRS